MSEATANPCTTLAVESLKERLAKYEDADGNTLVGVPFEPTPAMLDVAVSHALNVSLSGDYNWSQYMRDVWKRMYAAAPPAHIPAVTKMVSVTDRESIRRQFDSFVAWPGSDHSTVTTTTCLLFAEQIAALVRAEYTDIRKPCDHSEDVRALVPDGYTLAPIIPTPAMRVIGARDSSALIHSDQAGEVWKAMIGAVVVPTEYAFPPTKPAPDVAELVGAVRLYLSAANSEVTRQRRRELHAALAKFAGGGE